MIIKRAAVWLASLDPTIGSEIRKTRPVIVVSNNTNNNNNNVITVLPVSSNTTNVYSFEILIPKGVAGLPKESKVKTDQIRTIDKSRLIKSIGILPEHYMKLVNTAITAHLSLK